MPVEHVELVHFHQVKVVPEHRLGDVVPASVQVNDGDDGGDDNDDDKDDDDDDDDDKLYEVPACVEKDSSVSKPWGIFYLRSLHQVLQIS